MVIDLSVIINTQTNNTHTIPVKWFEVITSLVFIYFYKKQCDVAVIETGLGGTTDCTNIIEPIISIITSIGYDHVDILGDTLEKIATHKAGIIKKNSETVFVNQPEILHVIKSKCDKEDNKLHIIEKDDVKNYSGNKEIQKFDYKQYKNIEINLKGKVQIYNAAECLEAIDILKEKDFNIPEHAIYEGLKSVVHRARMEKISDNPVVIFDGGHNENAIKNFKHNAEQYYKNDKKVYIISILQTKDHSTIVKELSDDKEAIFYFTDGVKDKPYVPAKELAEEAKKYISEEQIHVVTIDKAIEEAKAKYHDRVIFVVGSFYVYKHVIEKFRQ